MPRSSNIQTAINALVRFRQFPRVQVIERPPVLGTVGFAETGNMTSVPGGGGLDKGLVYLPLAYEAAYGWGAPFGPNPPMGTVQMAWDPSAQIYRIVDNGTGSWVVTHQRTDLAAGGKWWLAPNGSDLISWVPVNGWRDLAASEASVPVGAQPIFQGGDVLTHHPTTGKIFSAVHDGTYLYVAYAEPGQTAYIDRTILTLGAGYQAPTWVGTGQISLPGGEGTNYVAMHMDLLFDGTECLLNVFSAGRDIPGWDLSNPNFRFYEEWTLDLTSFPSVSAVKTGDADTGLAHSWDTTEGKTVEEALALLAASARGFDFLPPPMTAPLRTNANLDYRIGDWQVDSYLFSWYDRQTQQRQRYTARLSVEYEQSLPATVGYTEDNSVLFAGIPAIAYCQDIGTGDLGCVKDTVFPFPGFEVGSWGQTIKKLYAHATLSLRLNGAQFGSIDLLAQDYSNDQRGGHYLNWAHTDTLPCIDTSGPGPDVPCGDGITDVQRLSLSPNPVAGQTIDEYGLVYPQAGDFLDDLDYALRNPIIIGNHGDMADIRGGLFQHAAEQVTGIVDGVPDLGGGRANYYWRIYDRIGGAALLEETRNNVALSNSGLEPPSHDKHETAASMPTEQEWSEWVKGLLNRFPLLRLYDFGLHFQPCIRLPNGAAFASFALYDEFPTVVPQNVLHRSAFTGGDLVVLTGLDQVVATDIRYTKLLENGTSGPALIVPGQQGLAGVL